MNQCHLKFLCAFMATLFDERDAIWVTNNVRERCYSTPQVAAIEKYFSREAPNGIYISINGSLAPCERRSSASVYALRNFLIEFDGLPLIEQRGFLKKRGIPYSACTFSGSQSLHFICSLTSPLASIAEYKAVASRLHHLLDKKNDPSCSDPSRFSRMPFAIRSGKMQTLLEVQSRIDTRAFLDRIFDGSPAGPQCAGTSLSTFHSGSRSDVADLLAWYVGAPRARAGTSIYVPCPICQSEGRDTRGDNLHISLPDFVFHCFSGGEEHDRRILPFLKKLWLAAGQAKRSPSAPISWQGTTTRYV